MKDLFFRTAAILALATYAPTAMFANDYALFERSGKKSLELYLERAKIQGSEERFMRLAQEGISAAIFDWEKNAQDARLYDAESWKAQRLLFERSLNEDVESSFKDWLLEKKSLERASLEKSALYEELQKAAENFFYVDSEGGQNKIVSRQNIEDARGQWEELSEKIILDRLHENFLPNDRDFLEACDSFYFAEQKVCNQLMNSLLYDHASLKRQSDQEEALFVAENLARQIELESDASLETLFNSLENEARSVDSGDVRAAAGQTWLEQFEREMQRLLTKWDKAEEDFLTCRAQWEAEAESLYTDESLQWQEAYKTLEERRQAWGEKISSQMQSGELEWQKKILQLDEEINEYLQKFEDSLFFDLDQKKQAAESKVQAYIQCRAILSTAQSGVESWGARWSEKYNGLYSYWKSEDSDFGRSLDLSSKTSSQLKSEIQKWKRDFCSCAKNLYQKTIDSLQERNSLSLSAIKEKEQSVLSLSEFSESHEIGEVCAVLYQLRNEVEINAGENFWNCLSQAEYLWTAPNELYEWLELFDKFSGRAKDFLSDLSIQDSLGSEIFDSLECEKTKAKSLLEVWERRYEIALAVSDYSQNEYSDIDSAERTERNLQTALDAFNKAKEEYLSLAALLEGHSLAVEEGKKRYYEALENAAALMRFLETAQEEYDDLYDQRSELYKRSYITDIYSVLSRLQELNCSSSAFESGLFCYASGEQAAFDEGFLAQVQEIREKIENGFDGMEAAPIDFEGLNGEEIEDAKENLALLGEREEKSLSMQVLQEIEDCLEEFIHSESETDPLQKILSHSDSIRVLEREGAEEFFQSAEDYGESFSEEDNSPEKDEALERLKEMARALSEKARLELCNREAALLLLDGSAREIHDFFDDNYDFNGIYDNYKNYSRAILREENDSARAILADLIEDYDGSVTDLEDYFEALDEISSNLSAADSMVLSLYKSALEAQEKNEGKEKKLAESLDECGLRGRTVPKLNFYIDSFKKYFFGELEESAADSDFDASLFLQKCSARLTALNELEGAVEKARDPSRRIREINSAILQKERDIADARNRFDAAVEKASGSSPDSAINEYLLLCEEYNSFLEQCALCYEKVKAARQEYRLAEEIYFYAQNEYLRENYDAREKLQAAAQNRDFFKNALLALESIQQNVPIEALDEFKQSYAQNFKAKALAAMYQREVEAQKARVCAAQEKERIALSKIVCEADCDEGAFEIPAAAKNLVLIRKDSNGGYSFGLDYAAAHNNGENKRLLIEYFTDKRVSEIDVYGNEFNYSQARQDAISFFDSLKNKQYSLADLALAAMFVKISSGAPDYDEWFESNENPLVNGFYKIGDLPDEVHGVELADDYFVGRLGVLRDAWFKVLSLGGEEDIAKFILHSQVNFALKNETTEIQQNALKAAALNEPMNAAYAAANSWKIAAAAVFVAYSAAIALSAIPFIGGWAAAIAAALLATALALTAVSNKLMETGSDVASIRDGCAKNLSSAIKTYNQAFFDLQEARDNNQKERERLDVLLCGGKSDKNEKLTWNDFSNAIDCMLEFDSKKDALSEYYYSLCDSTSGQKNLRDLFEAASKEKGFDNVQEALEKIALMVGQKKTEKESALEAEVERLGNDLSFDKARYYKELERFYSQDVLQTLPVALGGEVEDYQMEVFEDYLSLKNEALLYSESNKLEAKRGFFLALQEDMEAQHSSWLKNNQSILDAAQKEWDCAFERIQDGHSEWEADWSARYKAANDEWQSGYSDFLDQKQNWIYSQYVGASASEPSFDSGAKSRAAAACNVSPSSLCSFRA